MNNTNRTGDVCTRCGASVPGGTEGYRKLFEEILAREYTDPAFGNGSRQSPIESVPPNVTLPPGIIVKVWRESDFAAIQQLSSAEGWPTPRNRPSEALAAWRQSWPVFVATEGEKVIGLLSAGVADGFYQANGFRRFQEFRESYQ